MKKYIFIALSLIFLLASCSSMSAYEINNCKNLILSLEEFNDDNIPLNNGVKVMKYISNNDAYDVFIEDSFYKMTIYSNNQSDEYIFDKQKETLYKNKIEIKKTNYLKVDDFAQDVLVSNEIDYLGINQIIPLVKKEIINGKNFCKNNRPGGEYINFTTSYDSLNEEDFSEINNIIKKEINKYSTITFCIFVNLSDGYVYPELKMSQNDITLFSF